MVCDLLDINHLYVHFSLIFPTVAPFRRGVRAIQLVGRASEFCLLGVYIIHCMKPFEIPAIFVTLIWFHMLHISNLIFLDLEQIIFMLNPLLVANVQD